MPRDYLRRRMAEAVSQHTVKTLPIPTLADLHARIWDVAFQHRETKSGISYFVLALDEGQAQRFAWLRLAALWPDDERDAMDLVLCRQRSRESSDAMVSALEVETPEEYFERQDAYDSRGAA